MTTRDPGLQPERTAVAWQRTAAAMFVLAAAVILGAFRRGMWPVGVVGGLVAILTVLLIIRFRLRKVHGAANWPAAWPSLLRVSSVAIALSALGVVTAMVAFLNDR